VLSLGLRQLTTGEIEHFLAEKLQNLHVVLADRLVCLAGANDVTDESGPVFWPLVF